MLHGVSFKFKPRGTQKLDPLKLGGNAEKIMEKPRGMQRDKGRPVGA
jgi:hypothetical protein